MTFETIAYHVWSEEYVENELTAIHNIMSRLRQKLKISPDIPDYIISVRGVGYKFDTTQQKRIQTPKITIKNEMYNRGTYSAGQLDGCGKEAYTSSTPNCNINLSATPLACSLTTEYTLLQVLHSVFRAADGAAR